MSLRFRFLIAVNLTLLCVLAVFLVMDFRFQRSTQLAELSADTRRESRLLAEALLNIGPSEIEAMQSFLDRANEILRIESQSQRDLVVLSNGDILMLPENIQMTANHVAQLIKVLETEAVDISNGWVLGKTTIDNRQVYVLRDAAEAMANSTEHALWRLAEIGLLGMLATLLINLLLIRLIIRPFMEISKTIKRIGKGELGVTAGRFRSREFQLLAKDLNQMSMSLAYADRERGFQMAKARRLQERLQGDHVEVPGLGVVHWHCAADHVAGDYFDLLRCPNGEWLICIADVTGHGVAAAMGAAILKTLLWSAVESGAELDQILGSVNKRFSEVTLEEDFASLLLIRWSPDSRTLQYASAGHETAYLLSEGQPPTFLESTGTLVGIAHDNIWEIKCIAVKPGNRLVLYTDGIIEAFSPAGKQFGRERLSDILQAHTHCPIQATVDAVRQALAAHLNGRVADDDLTLVGLDFKSRLGE